MDEKTVCANIEKYVTLINDELKAAYELGLKVHVFGGGVSFRSGPERISLRVWREVPMVNTSPPFILDVSGPEAQSGRGKATKETRN